MFVLVGRCIRGRWSEELVIVGTLRKNNLFQTKEDAEYGLKSAVEYFSALDYPEIDPKTIRIAAVIDPIPLRDPKIINLKGNH